MAVLLEGINVPEGNPITINIYRNGTWINAYTTEDGNAIEIPEPHGRLIDADAMLMRINHEVMEAYMDGACYGVHPSQEHLYLLGEIIDVAPTVIPASEEGEV